jgi:hypothetical protein
MGTVGISYLQVTGLYENQSTIMVANGAFELDPNNPFSVYATIGITNLWTTPGTINFTVDATGDDTFDVTVDVGLATSGNGDPIIEMSGCWGVVSVVWPTAAGQQTQPLSPGQQVTLTGYTP